MLETRKLGRSGIDVSIVGLGTAPLGDTPQWLPGQPIPETQAIEVIQTALARGITFFDTAPIYGRGLSEQRLGKALKGVPRDHYVLATKAGWTPSAEHSPHVADFSHDGILRSVERSLKQLGVEKLDIVHLHDPDNHFAIALNSAFPALAALRTQGVIRAIGVGMNQWQMLVQFARHADFDCLLLAGRYTLLDQSALPLLDLCQKKQIAVVLGGIYNSGILATGAVPGARYNYSDAPAHIMEKVRQIDANCLEHGVTLHTAATQFALSHPAVTAAVIGMQTIAEVDQALQALHTSGSEELWEHLRRAGLLDAGVPIEASSGYKHFSAKPL